jgi:mono/diheme cytochrome c family protein/uncharacterized coiled-coil DUF342 family protein
MIRVAFLFVLFHWITFVFARPTLLAQETEPAKVTYDDHVKSIFQQRCSSCHGPSRKESDLDVTNYTNLMLGGGSGEVIAPGSADDSYLFRLISHTDAPEMPPSGKIPDAEIELIGKWITLGALENAGSKPKKMKPKLDLAQSGDALTRPETVVVPLRIPVEPVVRPARASVISVAASPWANVVALSTPRQVLLYAADSMELLGVLPFEEGTAHQLRFSRSGSLLLGAGGKDGKSGTTILWDVATGERITSVAQELDVILAADLTADQSLLAIGGPSKLVKVLSVDDGSPRFEIKKHTDWVTALEFSPDGKFLATGDRNGAIHVWETATGAEVFAIPGHTKSISALSWRLDSKILASASEDTTLRTWEMEKGGAVKNWAAHGGGVTDVQFMRDGQIATCGRDQLAKIWNQDGGLVRQFPALSDVAVSLAYCNDLNRLVAADWAGNIILWDAEGNEVGRLLANPPTLAERLSSANELLANTLNKFAPLEAELQVSTQKLNELKTSITTQQQQRDAAESKLNELKKQLAEGQASINEWNQQQAAAETEQKHLQNSIPLLEAALEKISAALEAMLDDAELKQSKAHLESKINSSRNRLAELESRIPQLVQQQTELQMKLDQSTAMISKETENLNSLNAMLTSLMSNVASTEKEVAEKGLQASQVSAEVEAAKQLVAKWQSENDFIHQLEALNLHLQSAEKSIEEKQSVENELQSALKELEVQLKDAQEQTVLTERQAEEIRQQMLQLRSASAEQNDPAKK